LKYVPIALFAIAAILFISDRVDATSQCQPGSPTSDTCMGISGVGTTTGGTGSGRCFYFTIQSVAPPCTTGGIITTGNQGAWELDPGACTTLYYHNVANGAVPPATPNKLTLSIFYDDTSTPIRTYQSLAAPPVTGTGFQLCATNDGTSTGSPRSGPALILIRAVKDNGNGLPGNTNYDIIMTGTGAQDTSFDLGFIRFKTVISDIAKSAYPGGGSTFAYGASGDESATITGSFTNPVGDSNRETLFTSILDESTLLVGQIGATVDVDTGSLAQAFVIDSTFPFASNPYNGCLTIVGNGYNGLKYSRYATTGHGATISIISDTFACNTVDINIDPRIKMDSDGTGGFVTADETDRSYVGLTCSGTLIDIFNRGENACSAWSLVNARDQYLSRSMTFARLDSINTVCASYGSILPVANVYTASGMFSTSATCLAAADTTGSTRHLLVTNTDQSYTSGTVYRLSSLYFLDAHVENDSTLTQDNFPTENANEDTTYYISNSLTDTVYGWCHVVGVRKDINIDTSGTALTWTYKDPIAATRLTGTTDTALDGWTPTHLDHLASTPLGTWTFTCSVTFNGNTGTNIQNFDIVVPEDLGGVFPGDPIKVSCTPTLAFVGVTVRCLIAETLVDGSGRTGNAANTNIDVRNAANSVVVSNAQPTEWQHGIYLYDFTPATSGQFSVAVQTLDVTTGNSIPGIYAFYVLDAWSTLTDVNNARDNVNTNVDAAETSINANVDAADTAINANVDSAETSINTNVDAVDTSIATLSGNNTNYHSHINDHLHNINMTVEGNVSVNNTEVLNAINQHRERSFEFQMDELLLLVAIAFFVIMGEAKKDALYWFFATILSIYLLINRSDESIIPLPIYVGWIFITLYQAVSLLMTKRAQNLSSTEE
jgi:hypothetical protein